MIIFPPAPIYTCMNTYPTIPCPVCKAPIYVRYMENHDGEMARVYTEPLSITDEIVYIHEHQAGGVDLRVLH